MNPTIGTLLQALSQIDKRDYEVAHATLIEDKVNVHGDRYSTYENNFTGKLNTEYTILSRQGLIPHRHELTAQLQIPKKFAYSEFGDPAIEHAFTRIINELGDDADPIRQFELIPDFIIHKGQDDMIPANQHLITEVKTEKNLSYKKFLWDFFKLNIYVEKLHFQTASFLVVNTASQKIKSHMDKYLRNNHYLASRESDIYIIVKENYESAPEVIKLWKYK